MSSEGEKEGGKREARDDLEQETQEGHHSTTYDGDGLAAVRSFLTI